MGTFRYVVTHIGSKPINQKGNLYATFTEVCVMSDTRPIYQQLTGGIRDIIISGELPEGEHAPSTNELSAFHSVNPTTSAKALTVLFAEGLLEKRGQVRGSC